LLALFDIELFLSRNEASRIPTVQNLAPLSKPGKSF